MAVEMGKVIGIETSLNAREEVRLLNEIDSPGIKSILNFRTLLRMEEISVKSYVFWEKREFARFIVPTQMV